MFVMFLSQKRAPIAVQVGLVPLASLLDAAEFYMEKEGLMVLEEDQKVIFFMFVDVRST